MKSARDEFGPPRSNIPNDGLNRQLNSNSIRDQISAAGQTLAKNGVTQDAKQANMPPAKKSEGDHSAHKDLAVKAGDRAALSPCDGKTQANSMADVKQAGQSLQNAGVTKSASQQQPAPKATPSSAAPSQGRSR